MRQFVNTALSGTRQDVENRLSLRAADDLSSSVFPLLLRSEGFHGVYFGGTPGRDELCGEGTNAKH